MNEEAKQALLLKYKDVLDKFENINSEDYHNYEMSFGEWVWKSFYSEDILPRLLSKTYHELSISSQPYSKFILYFKESDILEKSVLSKHSSNGISLHFLLQHVSGESNPYLLSSF